MPKLPVAPVGALVLIFFMRLSPLVACGYHYLGTCSSYIFMQIDGQRDSFPVAACTYGTQFDGLDFGPVWSLNLRKLRAHTWESCFNKVLDGSLFLRVYEEGAAPGQFQQWAMPLDSVRYEGPYRTRYRTLGLDMDLLAGLMPGHEYVMELFFAAQVDTTQDGVADLTIYENNDGRNFKARFRPASQSEAPFTVVVTKALGNVCHGGSSGVASVYAFGQGQTFDYLWASGSHFWALFDLPAGDYPITVTNSSGFQIQKTVSISEPPPLVRAVQRTLCSGDSLFFGGQMRYQAGHYEFSKPAPNGCDSLLSLDLAFADPTASLATLPDSIFLSCRSPQKMLCADGAPPGFAFNWSLGSQSACQNVELGSADGAFVTLWAMLDGKGCSASDFIKIIADQAPPAFSMEKTPHCDGTATVKLAQFSPTNFVWSPAVPGQSPFELTAGQYFLTAENVESGCTTTDTVEVFEKISFSMAAKNGSDDANTGVALIDSLQGGLPPYSIVWETGETTDSIEHLWAFQWYAATVTDAEGCAVSDSVFVDAFVAVKPVFDEKSLELAPNPTIADLTVELPTALEDDAFRFEIFDQKGALVRSFASRAAGKKRRLDVSGLPAGPLMLRAVSEKTSVAKWFLKI